LGTRLRAYKEFMRIYCKIFRRCANLTLSKCCKESKLRHLSFCLYRPIQEQNSENVFICQNGNRSYSFFGNFARLLARFSACGASRLLESYPRVYKFYHSHRGWMVLKSENWYPRCSSGRTHLSIHLSL